MIETVQRLVWGRGLIGLILAVGLYLSVRTRFVQVRLLGRALKYAVKNESDGAGEVSAFGALCTALAATLGTGNIVGVATAIAAGGPGALLWMLLAAFFGMATKYAEGLLAVNYRRETSPGHFLGGPFCYIERGLGAKWRPLARLFAVFGALAGLFGVGTIAQVNSITAAVEGVLDPAGRHTVFTLFGKSCSAAAVITGAAVTLCAAPAILGGVRRIAKVSQAVVPFMAGFYLFFSLLILLLHLPQIPSALRLICVSAFHPSAVGGAIGGLTLQNVVRMGVGRGIFSNEAGLGSAPIAAASARTNDPARQGLVTMTGAFIDTFAVCSVTGLAIVVTGAWDPRITGAKLEGAALTAYAWQKGLPFGGDLPTVMLTLCLGFFAFTTILGWSFYGERCLEYLSGRRRAVRVYRLLYIAAVMIGPYLTVGDVWNIADICNGLMAFPNLAALFLLAGVAEKETPPLKSRRSRQRAGRGTKAKA